MQSVLQLTSGVRAGMMGQAEQEQLKSCLVWDGLVCKKCILSLARLPSSPAQLWQWRARNSYIAGNSAQAMGTGETAGGISQAHLTNQLNRLSRLHRKPKLQRLHKTQECTSCLFTSAIQAPNQFHPLGRHRHLCLPLASSNRMESMASVCFCMLLSKTQNQKYQKWASQQMC
jgi:hypothetical protein